MRASPGGASINRDSKLKIKAAPTGPKSLIKDPKAKPPKGLAKNAAKGKKKK